MTAHISTTDGALGELKEAHRAQHAELAQRIRQQGASTADAVAQIGAACDGFSEKIASLEARAASRNAPPETTVSPTLFPLFSCREFPGRRAGLRARARARSESDASIANFTYRYSPRSAERRW